MRYLELHLGLSRALQALQLRYLNRRRGVKPGFLIHQAQQADLKLQVRCWIAGRSRSMRLI